MFILNNLKTPDDKESTTPSKWFSKFVRKWGAEDQDGMEPKAKASQVEGEVEVQVEVEKRQKDNVITLDAEFPVEISKRGVVYIHLEMLEDKSIESLRGALHSYLYALIYGERDISSRIKKTAATKDVSTVSQEVRRQLYSEGKSEPVFKDLEIVITGIPEDQGVSGELETWLLDVFCDEKDDSGDKFIIPSSGRLEMFLYPGNISHYRKVSASGDILPLSTLGKGNLYVRLGQVLRDISLPLEIESADENRVVETFSVKKGEKIAYKTLVASSDEKTGELIKRQALLLNELDHPQIMKCRGVVQKIVDNGDSIQTTLLMEYIEGSCLSEVLDKHGGTFRVEQVVDFGVQMTAILQYLLEKECSHRDLKPSNFVLSEDGILKLCDFDLAGMNIPESRKKVFQGLCIENTNVFSVYKNFDEDQENAIPPCTPDFVSVDEISDVESHDIKLYSDIYSFGLILYRFLTGTNFFKNLDSDYAIFQRLLIDYPSNEQEIDMGVANVTDISSPVAKLIDELLIKMLQNEEQERVNLLSNGSVHNPYHYIAGEFVCISQQALLCEIEKECNEFFDEISQSLSRLEKEDADFLVEVQEELAANIRIRPPVYSYFQRREWRDVFCEIMRRMFYERDSVVQAENYIAFEKECDSLQTLVREKYAALSEKYNLVMPENDLWHLFDEKIQNIASKKHVLSDERETRRDRIKKNGSDIIEMITQKQENDLL